MIGPAILAILCHSAFLNVFMVILNAPAGVVAPSILEAEEAGSVVHDAHGSSFSNSQTRDLGRGGGDLNGSGSRGDNQFDDAATSLMYSSGPIFNDLVPSDENTLLRLATKKDETVRGYKKLSKQYSGSGGRSGEKGYHHVSPDRIAILAEDFQLEGRKSSDLF
ncbi:hypothetical protein Pst134EB_018247 [Puccinia striiformis f. sp. tritici]|nr:hypothetical protein Pst134EB_018247 [Puccinia striiformis f. sp. tritici]